MKPAGARLSASTAASADRTAELAADARYYLSLRPRQLPSRYLYDALGSALFDAICLLPWYRITRAETGLLQTHAAAILGALLPLGRVVELGPGSGQKLLTLMRAAPASARALDLHLVDVSRAALVAAGHTLAELEGVRVVGHEASYEDGLALAAREAGGAGRTLALFLGSNIGNFDPPGEARFLRRMRAALRPGDGLLLGADLVKPERDLLLAYDDPLGVTAAFNRNLLARLNRELDGDIDPSSFRHRAVWNAAASRVEMHLVSTRPQRLRLRRAGVDVALREGEPIWTESSYKYRAEGIGRRLVECGFAVRAPWIDEDAQFALTLAEVP